MTVCLLQYVLKRMDDLALTERSSSSAHIAVLVPSNLRLLVRAG